ncbi:MAG: hypothetical protein JST54_34540 [Deltaproteobacteria bacterium]|nr:hypothetical protein [Deltaproteobacteria bacterium]
MPDAPPVEALALELAVLLEDDALLDDVSVALPVELPELPLVAVALLALEASPVVLDAPVPVLELALVVDAPVPLAAVLVVFELAPPGELPAHAELRRIAPRHHAR